MAKVLVVDRDPESCAFVSQSLIHCDYGVFAAFSDTEAVEIIRSEKPAVAIVDLTTAASSDLPILSDLRKEDHLLNIIVLAPWESVRTAVRAMRLGACDYLPKPVRGEDLAQAVSRALAQHELRQEVHRLRARISDILGFEQLIGESDAWRRTLELAHRAAASDVKVLLVGESGTGKELLAHAIHQNGSREKFPFVTVDCASIPESLIESELFGYEKGAFTGADRRKPGRFEMADKGTLFLDEIDTVPENIQIKLLRAIDTGEISRLGGLRSVNVDVRILAATNRDLGSAVQSGRFREDLFYRLNVLTIELPPLRERQGDVRLLAEHFIGLFSKKHGRPISAIEPEAVADLEKHAWPGNVRELKNVTERAVILSDERITADVLSIAPRSEASPTSDEDDLKKAMESASREVAVNKIHRAMEECGGNKTKAAKRLGISLKTLYNLMHRYKL